MSEIGTPEVKWGTAALKSGFSGIVRVSEIRTSDKSFEGKPPAEQLYWEIEPTSYEADAEKWPKAWYNVSESSKSKWARLQERLEQCKCLPKTGAEDLIGLEFEFERVDLTFGKDKEGVEMTAREVLLPKKLIKDHRKGGKDKTKGSSDPASLPSKAKVEEPTETVKEPEKPKGTVDIESVILDEVAKQPVVLAEFYKRMNKNYGISRTDVFRKVKAMHDQGLVKLDSEGGTLVKSEE
jgi:hypothetical protein